MLQFYWSVGADIVNLRVESKWGEGVIKLNQSGSTRSTPRCNGALYRDLRDPSIPATVLMLPFSYLTLFRRNHL